MTDTKLRKKISDLKKKYFGSVVINAKVQNNKYEMRLLTQDSLHNEELIELLGKWRKANEKWFLSQFEISSERTKKWLKERVIDDPDKVLFVLLKGKKFIGHIGLYKFDFEKNTCEIDNVIRGEKDLPGLMSASMVELMQWGSKEFGIKMYELKVREDNVHAVRFYEKLGYKTAGKIPLIYKAGPNGRELVELTPNDNTRGDKYYLIMEKAFAS